MDANDGLDDVYSKIASLPEAVRKALEADVVAAYGKLGPGAMVDSHRGITKLYVPSDTIVDKSMPTAICGGGEVLDEDDGKQDFSATIPVHVPIKDWAKWAVRRCRAN